MKKRKNIENLDLDNKSLGFKVPERYFEELPFKIYARKEIKEKRTAYWLWTSSAVAVCALVLGLFLFDNGEEQVDYYSESIERDMYQYEYLEEEISEEDLIDIMISED